MKTQPKQYALFKKECSHWLKTFGLTEWDVSYELKRLDTDSPDAEIGATCAADLGNRVAVILMQSESDCKLTTPMIKKIAFHEVCHLLLWRLVALGNKRDMTENALEDEAHAVIRRLENSILGK